MSPESGSTSLVVDWVSDSHRIPWIEVDSSAGLIVESGLLEWLKGGDPEERARKGRKIWV